MRHLYLIKTDKTATPPRPGAFEQVESSFKSAIVVAETITDARRIHPGGFQWDFNKNKWGGGNIGDSKFRWTYYDDPEIEVEDLGETLPAKGRARGVVLATYTKHTDNRDTGDQPTALVETSPMNKLQLRPSIFLPTVFGSFLFREETPQQHSDSLKRAVTMGNLMRTQMARVKELEALLSDEKKCLTKISTEDLPLLMTELQLKEITLDDGSKITVKSDLSCTITELKRDACLQWLTSHGFDGLIKTHVVTSFGKGQHDSAVSFAIKTKTEYKNVTLKENVHPSTLKAFIKEQLEEGNTIPSDLFGIHSFNIVKLTSPKKRT